MQHFGVDINGGRYYDVAAAGRTVQIEEEHLLRARVQNTNDLPGGFVFDHSVYPRRQSNTQIRRSSTVCIFSKILEYCNKYVQ